MDEIIEVNPIGMKKLDNGQHLTFHSRAYELVDEYEAAKIGIPEPLKVEWKGNIGTENDISQEVVAETLTQRISEKDAERDRIITYIFKTIRASIFSPDTTEAAAAEELILVAKKYGQLQSESYDRESGHVNGFVFDLKKAENTPHVTALHLSSALTKLETANNEFEALYRQGVKTARRNDLPRASAVRPKTDANYNRVLLMLQVAYISGAAPIDRDALKKLAKDLNNLVDKAEAAYNQSLAQRKAASKKKPKDPKDPKPKDPKDPKKPEGGGDDIQIPSEPPKKPEDKDKPKQPETGGGTGGGGDDIQIPSEPPKKPDGQ